MYHHVDSATNAVGVTGPVGAGLWAMAEPRDLSGPLLMMATSLLVPIINWAGKIVLEMVKERRSARLAAAIDRASAARPPIAPPDIPSEE